MIFGGLRAGTFTGEQFTRLHGHMNHRLKQCLVDWIPPRLLRIGRDLRQRERIAYTGRFASWDEAGRASEGYDTTLILDKVKSSLEKVRDGQAVYERDSVLFDRVQYSFPLLAGLLRAASASGNNLNVLDVGGSLGTSYFQCRNFLDKLDKLTWNIVEQPAFVDCGREHFQTEQLRFYTTIESCLAKQNVNAALLSSVLPYVEDPHALLDKVLRNGIPHVLIDRTPLIEGASDRLTVQHVPAAIYGRETSYPAWILSRRTLVSHFEGRYNLIAEFDALSGTVDLGDTQAQDTGFLFEIRGDERT